MKKLLCLLALSVAATPIYGGATNNNGSNWSWVIPTVIVIGGCVRVAYIYYKTPQPDAAKVPARDEAKNVATITVSQDQPEQEAITIEKASSESTAAHNLEKMINRDPVIIAVPANQNPAPAPEVKSEPVKSFKKSFFSKLKKPHGAAANDLF